MTIRCCHAGQLLQNCANLLPAQHDGQSLRSTGAHNRRHGADLDRERLVEKQHRAERLVLRRGADPSLDREPRQKPRNGRRAKGRWVLLLVEHDVPTNPVDVRFLGPRAVVTRPNRMAHPIEKLRAGSQRLEARRRSASVERRLAVTCEARQRTACHLITTRKSRAIPAAGARRCSSCNDEWRIGWRMLQARSHNVRHVEARTEWDRALLETVRRVLRICRCAAVSFVAGRTAIARSCWLEPKDDAIIVLDQVGNAEGCAITQVRGCQNHFT